MPVSRTCFTAQLFTTSLSLQGRDTAHLLASDRKLCWDLGTPWRSLRVMRPMGQRQPQEAAAKVHAGAWRNTHCPEVQVHWLTRVALLHHAAFSSAVPTAPARPQACKKQMRLEASAQPLEDTSRRAVLGTGLALAAAAAAPLSMPGAALANKVLSSDWEQVGSRAGDGNAASHASRARALAFHP